MRTKLLILLFLPLIAMRTLAQDTTFVSYYKLDISVPDLPAFKALGTEPSDIMRPSDIKDFSAIISPFYSNGAAIIPKNFALEVAPWKIRSKNWKLEEYKGAKKTLYNTGFSLGTVRDSSDNSSRIAVGARMTFVPRKQDIIYIGAYALSDPQQKLTQALHTLEIDRLQHANEYVDLDTFISALHGDPNKFGATVRSHWDTVMAQVPKVPKDKFTEAGLLETFSKTIADSILKTVTKWNTERYDISVALVSRSADSLLSRAQFGSLHFWAVAAWPLGEKGQFLLGQNFAFLRNKNRDSMLLSSSTNLRLYRGENVFKGFIEAQYKYKNNEVFNQSLLFNLGAEFRLGDKFWVVATAGINNYLDTPDPMSVFVSSLDIRYGLNQKK